MPKTVRYLAIVGPTCIGKTAYLNELARRLPIDLINLDSFQIYSHFAVGTGRRDLETDHAHLYGFIDPSSTLAPNDYLVYVREALDDIAATGRTPVFEGGSISYLRALQAEFTLRLIGLRPPAADDVMRYVDERIARYDEEVLLNEIRTALDRGLRHTLVLQDDVVYLPILEYLDGHLSHAAAFQRIRENLFRRFNEQMRQYAAFDIEWIDVDENTAAHLEEIVRSMLAECV